METAFGTYDGVYPSTTTTPKKTGFEWLNAILSGANNILGTLFPSGLNNSVTGTVYPGQNPTTTPQTSNNNALLFGLVAIVVLFFLFSSNDKK